MANDQITRDEATEAAIDFLKNGYDITEPNDDILLCSFAQETGEDGIAGFWFRYEITLSAEDDRTQRGALHGVRLMQPRQGFHLIEFIDYQAAR